MKTVASEMINAYRCGYVAVAGRPNVGKSTLVNAFVGQKIAAVSPKPQTTRMNQMGMLSREDAQVIFIDTPGLHLARHKLGEGMNALAQEALHEADEILWLVDASQPPHEEDQLITEKLAEIPKLPVVLQVLNKVDLVNSEVISQRQKEFHTLFPHVKQAAVSALTGLGVSELLQTIIMHLPHGEPFYPSDQITDQSEREIAADLIREAALEHLREEVPHALAVRVDQYQERGEGGAFIAATLFVEKESQKGIVIGRGAEMLKRIGSSARQAIESMSSRKIFLELRVKVSKNWRSNPAFLKQMGFPNSQERP